MTPLASSVSAHAASAGSVLSAIPSLPSGFSYAADATGRLLLCTASPVVANTTGAPGAPDLLPIAVVSASSCAPAPIVVSSRQGTSTTSVMVPSEQPENQRHAAAWRYRRVPLGPLPSQFVSSGRRPGPSARRASQASHLLRYWTSILAD
jgi:hypothetical protein